MGWGVCRVAPLEMEEGKGKSWVKSCGDAQRGVFIIDWGGGNPEGGGESWSPSREPTWSPLPPAPTTRGKQTPRPARPRRCWGAGQRARLRASLALSHWRPRCPGALLPFHRPEARMCGRGPQRGAPRFRVGCISDEN